MYLFNTEDSIRFNFFIVIDITGCEVNNGGPSAILWQFGQEREIASYYGCQGKATRIHFDQFGQKFGAGDTAGNLCLWRFDAHAHSNKPYYVIFILYLYTCMLIKIFIRL